MPCCLLLQLFRIQHAWCVLKLTSGLLQTQAGIHTRDLSARTAAKGTPFVVFCRLWVTILRSVLGYLEVFACSSQLNFYWRVATVGGVELQAGVTVWGLVQIQSVKARVFFPKTFLPGQLLVPILSA